MGRMLSPQIAQGNKNKPPQNVPEQFLKKLRVPLPPNKHRGIENKNPVTTEHPLAKYKLPQYDDFSSPIRWVKFNSDEITDGLARVTDPETGLNKEYTIDEVVYVPIIDENVERLGFTTQRPQVLTTEKIILRSPIDIEAAQHADVQDWLAKETLDAANGTGFMTTQDKRCESDGCRARCRNSGCQSTCIGDTCSAGCEGPSCSAFCKGSGCFAMCLGEKCTAICDGMACDSRCRGSECESTCERFSCSSTINGADSLGGGTWNEHYPEYGVRESEYKAPPKSNNNKYKIKKNRGRQIDLNQERIPNYAGIEGY